jgi:hypothetical protein
MRANGFAGRWKNCGDYRGIERNPAAERLAAEGCTATDLAAAKAAIARQTKVQIDTVTADLSQSSAVARLARDFS